MYNFVCPIPITNKQQNAWKISKIEINVQIKVISFNLTAIFIYEKLKCNVFVKCAAVAQSI
jgi:hypothetical protein